MTEGNNNAKWRESVLREARIGRRLERLAVRLELPDAHCRPTWDPPAIDVVEIGADLAWFAAAVKRVAARLGSADSVKAENWIGTGDRAPDLIARWVLVEDVGQRRSWERDQPAKVEVTVRCLAPSGCKVDPRTEYVPATKLSLHPECVAVLRELEDV